MPPLNGSCANAMVVNPAGSAYGLTNKLAYCCGFWKPTCSAMPCDSTWFLISTFHRSAPIERPLIGSQRAPAVHCFDVSGFRPLSPESPFGPARRSYCALPGRQPARTRKRAGIRARGGAGENQRARDVGHGGRPETGAVGAAHQQFIDRQPARRNLVGGLAERVAQIGIRQLIVETGDGIQVRSEHPAAARLVIVVIAERRGGLQRLGDGDEPLGVGWPNCPDPCPAEPGRSFRRWGSEGKAGWVENPLPKDNSRRNRRCISA